MFTCYTVQSKHILAKVIITFISLVENPKFPENPFTKGGGIWTPASLMGESLVEKLEKHAGISFEEET